MALFCSCLSDVMRTTYTYVPESFFSVAETHQSNQLRKQKTPTAFGLSAAPDMALCVSSTFSRVWENWRNNLQIWRRCTCRLTAQMNLIVCTKSVLLLHTVATPIWLFFFALTDKMYLIGVWIINAIEPGFDPAPCQEMLCSPICCKTAFSSALFLF